MFYETKSDLFELDVRKYVMFLQAEMSQRNPGKLKAFTYRLAKIKNSCLQWEFAQVLIIKFDRYLILVTIPIQVGDPFLNIS